MSSSFGLILWFTCLNILSIVGNRHQNFPVWLLSLRKYESSKNKRTHNLLKIKGGATALSEILKSNGDINNNAKSTSSEEVVPNLTGNVTVTVTTSIGSSFLDKIKRLSISRNASILELKQSIRDKFPGNPPMQLQRLFYGFRILGNHSQKVGELTTSPQVPILLDMLSGTSGYNKTMSISQAVEAYVAVQVHHTYLSLAMQKVFNSRETITENELKPSSTTTTTTTEGAVTGATTSSSPEQQTEQNKLESLTLREIFDVVNRSVYEQYGEEIALALEREKEPEMIAGDTIAWRRGSALSERNPLQSAWAKQFDTNKQVALALVYYSVILVVSKY